MTCEKLLPDRVKATVGSGHPSASQFKTASSEPSSTKNADSFSARVATPASVIFPTLGGSCDTFTVLVLDEVPASFCA